MPHAEAARLLANRAVGIALSNLEREDRDLRRARHGHKAVLACGDARLLAADVYRPTVAARVVEITRQRGAPAIGDELAFAYADAAAFRTRPDHWAPPGDQSLDAWSRRIIDLVGRSHLSYEALRVGTPASPAGYANHRGALFRGAPDVAQGPLAAFRAWSRGRAPVSPWVGHPRERLARVAVALAYGHEHPGTRAIAARLLGLAKHDGEGASGSRAPRVSDEALHAALSRLAEVAG
ncbi:MAG: hypothetical protein JRH11_18250 [Deltaproteobacteria bacterium]|nr:hypothetical protein [Deltaproteobacteria bacterium]